MTLFEELYALALGATLTLTVSADEKTARLTVNVIPKPRTDAGEPALAQPLSLTAAPQEFDEGFIAALTGYRGARLSLAQQAEATKEVIDAAKAASVKKAGDAVSKASKPHATAPTVSKTTVPVRQTVESGAGDGTDALDEEEEGAPLASGGEGSGSQAPAKGESYDLFG